MVSLQTAVLALAVFGAGDGETVLLDFYADWCIPCRQMDLAVQELAARGYPVRKVNLDQDRALAAKYGVDRVPCFVMLVDGQVVDRVVGGTTFSRLERMCTMAQASRQKTQPGPPSGASPGSQPDAISIPAVQRDPAFAEPPRQSLAGPPDPRSADQTPLPGGRLSTPNWMATAAGTNPAVDDLIAATVRLRIEDPNGHSCGSGTIIDARGGEALIVTCGHIFRDSKGRGPIEVDLFGPSPLRVRPNC